MSQFFKILFCLLFFQNISWAQTWHTRINETSGSEFVHSIVQTPDGGYLIAGWTKPESDIVTVKLSGEGKKQWSRILNHREGAISWDEIEPSIVLNPDGTLFISATTIPNTNPVDGKLIVWHLNADGSGLDSFISESMYLTTLKSTSENKFLAAGEIYNCVGFSCNENRGLLLFDNDFQLDLDLTPPFQYSMVNRALDAIELDDSNIIMFGVSADYQSSWTSKIILELYDKNNNYEIKKWIIENGVGGAFPFNGRLLNLDNKNVVVGYDDGQYKIKMLNVENFSQKWEHWFNHQFDFTSNFNLTSDGGFIVAGTPSDTNITLVKLDSLGDTEWQKTINVKLPRNPQSPPNFPYAIDLIDIIQANDGGFVLTGEFVMDWQTGKYDMFVLKTDKNGDVGGFVQGYLRDDISMDCVAEDNEPGLKDWIVEFRGDTSSFFTTTDANGYCSLSIPIGAYHMYYSYPGSNFFTSCQQGNSILVPNQTDTITFRAAIQGIQQCPLISVDVSIPFVRTCTTNVYKVNYCNFGMSDLDSIDLVVRLGDYINFLSASSPFSFEDSSYQFIIYDLQSGECGSIELTVFLDCQTPIGNQYCLEAQLELDSQCHPSQSGNHNPLHDKDCQNSKMPVDPNNKTVNPIGEGVENKISSDTTLLYTINFQNVGTDTAFRVILIDTLSDLLDIHSFWPGGASHPYHWEIFNQGILKIYFDDILLPDSMTDATRSKGYVTFEIRPISGLLPGLRIENDAAIYFDYAAPVVTNRVFQTIDKEIVNIQTESIICQGETVNGLPLYQDTILVDTIHNSFTDTIIFNSVHVLPVFDSLHRAEFCQGDINPLTGLIFPDEGEYLTAYESINQWGCDSINRYQFIVHASVDDSLWLDLPWGSEYENMILTEDTVFVREDTTKLGCPSRQTYVINVLTTGTSSDKDLNQFRIYPNPFSNKLWIQVPSKSGIIPIIYLYDIHGKKIIQNIELKEASENIFYLETKGLSEGVYILQIKSEDNVQVYPIIKID